MFGAASAATGHPLGGPSERRRAHLQADEPGGLLRSDGERVADGLECPRPLLGRGLRPGLERPPGRADRAVDVVGTTACDASQHAAVGGVDDLGQAVVLGRGHPLPADEQAVADGLVGHVLLHSTSANGIGSPSVLGLILTR
jgi:hypothetical protein